MDKTKYKLKQFPKKILALIGLYHPSLGIKIDSDTKVQIQLDHKIYGMTS